MFGKPVLAGFIRTLHKATTNKKTRDKERYYQRHLSIL